jgi:hypothetical protein
MSYIKNVGCKSGVKAKQWARFRAKLQAESKKASVYVSSCKNLLACLPRSIQTPGLIKAPGWGV